MGDTFSNINNSTIVNGDLSSDPEVPYEVWIEQVRTAGFKRTLDNARIVDAVRKLVEERWRTAYSDEALFLLGDLRDILAGEE